MPARAVTLAAVLALALPARAAVHVLTPAHRGEESGSAVTVRLQVDDPAEAASLVVRLNGHDVTARLRGTGVERTLVLAGLPSGVNPVRFGANRLVATTATSRVETRFAWRPGRARVRVVAVGNRLDFEAYVSTATWAAEVDRIFAELVVPHLAAGRPNVVVLTEDFGLPTGLLGSRGAAARAAEDADALTALSNLFVTYAAQSSFYLTNFTLPGTGLQPPARALTLALTDTLWRNFHPLLAAKADAHDVWLAACNNVAAVRRSTDPADVAFFGDVDDPARTDVFLPDGIDVWNTCFLWGPDGAEIGRTKKVFLTPPEIELLNLSTGTLDEVEVFDTPAGRIAFAISRDAFIDEYVRRLDDLGAVLVLQPDANPGFWGSPPGRTWEPDGWTRSVLGMLDARYPNVTYNATSMMVGNFFPGTVDASGNLPGILFDGQSSITARAPRFPKTGFVALAPARELGHTGRFLAVAPWAFPDPVTLPSPAALDALRARCGSAVGAGRGPHELTLAERRLLLWDCARSLLPDGLNAGQYRENVAVADVEVPVARAQFAQ